MVARPAAGRPTTRILSGAEIRDLLDAPSALAAVERAFGEHRRGETIMPAKVYLPLERFGGDFRAMPVCAGAAAGVKWVNAHPDNPERHGLPSVMAVFIYSDPDTALPLAIMDATHLTAMRTGAAAAVATKYLAPGGARRLGLIGCGVQARTVLACHAELMTLDQVLLADRSPQACDRLASEFPELPCRTVEPARAAAADVVCTMTPSREPIVRAEWIAENVHINAMGADAPGKQELDPEILAGARIFLDDIEQATESGEVNVALRQRRLQREAIAGTLGAVVAGRAEGRRGEGVTIFDSTGLAVQDLAVAGHVYQEARRRGVGAEIELVEL